MNIGIIYRLPQGNVTVFVEELIKIVTEINADNKSEIYIVRDFNINYLKKTLCDTKKLKSFEHMTGLKQIIKEPTRYNKVWFIGV